MIQFLEFTFSSFWHFMGVYLLLEIVCQLFQFIGILIYDSLKNDRQR